MADITKGLKQVKKLPNRGVLFTYTPLPDGGGGIGISDCISGPCEICMSRPGRRIPDGFLPVECRCRPDPKCPDLPNPAGNCRLVFRRQSGIWRLVCENINCTGGNCQMRAVREGRIWRLFCACQ